jgi:hypothetical protein
MAREVINVGQVPNDGLGDPIRTAYIKCNNNFGELYSFNQSNPPNTLVGAPGDRPGMYAYDQNFFYWCYREYDGSSEIWGTNPNITITQIINGTSNVVVGDSANIAVSVGGQSNVAVFSATGTTFSNAAVIGTLAVQGNSTFANLLPATDTTYDLGSPDRRWNSLYVSGNTIFLGNAEISTDGDDIVFVSPGGSEFVIGGGAGNADGSFGNVTASGDVAAQRFFGDGQFLTNITVASNVAVNQIANSTTVVSVVGPGEPVIFTVNGVSNVMVVTNDQVQVSGDLISNNVTSNSLVIGAVNIINGTIDGVSDINVSANAAVGNISATGSISAVGDCNANLFNGNRAVFTGSVSANNVNVSASVTVGDLLSSPRSIITDATQSTSISTGALIVNGGAGFGANITVGGNVTTTGGILSSGNISGNFILGNGSQLTGISVDSTRIINGTSNVSVVSTNGNVQTTVAGNVISTVSTSGISVTGFLQTTGNISGGNLISTGSINANAVSALGTITASQFTGSGSGLTDLNIGNVSVGVLGVAFGGTGTGVSTGTGSLVLSQSPTLVTPSIGVASATSLTASGNITAGNLITSGAITSAVLTASGNITAGNLITSGAITSAVLTASGNITAGNLITSVVNLSSITKTGSNGIGNIGSTTNRFDTIFAKATSAQYADIAENYVGDQNYPSGTVVSFGGTHEITMTEQDQDSAVAGVISQSPSYLMNSGLESDVVLPVALLGRVMCKVTGSIKKGQLLVSAGGGRARAEAAPRAGCIIGKSLEDFDGTDGVIEIVVGIT